MTPDYWTLLSTGQRKATLWTWQCSKESFWERRPPARRGRQTAEAVSLGARAGRAGQGRATNQSLSLLRRAGLGSGLSLNGIIHQELSRSGELVSS